jgi:pimeloyl-ACP methyl ester carboxylesterase/DNA-binding CsgD family transcriptional regulator
MDQSIRFATAPDGVRIAYAVSGSGPPLVVCQGWISNLELDWVIPFSRKFWEIVGERYTVVRYDRRGTGLSDRKVRDYSLEAQTGDLSVVVDAVGAGQIALIGFSAGGPVSVAYAAAHPDIVSHLILYGTYASGSYAAISELSKALIRLIEVDWGGMGSLAMADIYIPGVSTEQREAFASYQQQCATKDAAVAQATAVGDFNVKHLLRGIETPTLVLHKRGDRAVPFELGRRLARDLPNSRFVPLDGNYHILGLENTKAFLNAMFEFLETPGAAGPAPIRGVTRRERDVLRLVAAGMSNRQIAEELHITINTADRHVSNILSKIGASNRAEAASFAVRHGIA